MKRLFVIPACALLLAACGGTAAPPPPSTGGQPAVSSAPASVPAASAAASRPPVSSAASAPASGVRPSPTFVDDKVQAFEPGAKLTLTNGMSFNLGANTGFIKLEQQKPSDLKPGQFVAITAKLQPDHTLLASSIRIASEPEASAPQGNQFPMDAGNLMTNAPVKSADNSGMVVTLPGGDITVKFAQNAEILRQAPGAASDVQPGKRVLVISVNGNAAAIGVFV